MKTVIALLNYPMWYGMIAIIVVPYLASMYSFRLIMASASLLERTASRCRIHYIIGYCCALYSCIIKAILNGVLGQGEFVIVDLIGCWCVWWLFVKLRGRLNSLFFTLSLAHHRERMPSRQEED